MKCGECKNQKFFPADDAAYRSHLVGDHVMGVYPRLPDSTCWLLAVDFDKASWTDDVRAFIVTCRKLELPFVVERSRSGKGAHVWLEMQLGPVRFAIDAKSQASKRPFQHRLIARETAFRANGPDVKIQELSWSATRRGTE